VKKSHRLPAIRDNRRRRARALEAELDVARQEVLNTVGDVARKTRLLVGVDTGNTVCGKGREVGLVDNELHLAERAASGDDRLTHVLQETRARAVDGGEVRVANTRVRAAGTVHLLRTDKTPVRLLDRGRTRHVETTLLVRATSTTAEVDGINDALEGRNRHEVAEVVIILLSTSQKGSHFILDL